MGPSANTSSLNETEIPSWIRGYHVYQDTWEIEIGEVLDLIHEPNNEHDKNAIGGGHWGVPNLSLIHI